MDFSTVQETIRQLQDEIESSCRQVPAHELGLDSRCGMVYVGGDFIASPYPGNLDYYGGFEYVDPDYTQSLGDWKLYSNEDDRVSEALARLAEEE